MCPVEYSCNNPAPVLGVSRDDWGIQAHLGSTPDVEVYFYLFAGLPALAHALRQPTYTELLPALSKLKPSQAVAGDFAVWAAAGNPWRARRRRSPKKGIPAFRIGYAPLHLLVVQR